MSAGIADALQRLVAVDAGATTTTTTTLGEILARLGGRGFGFAMLLLAAPNLTPGPSLPGFSTLFGVPMLLLAIGMLRGRPNPHLPRLLAGRRIDTGRLARFVALITPMAARADRVLRPRWPRLAGAAWLQGGCFALLGVLLALPLPLVSLAAAGAALMLAFGLLAEDGLAIALGLAATAATLALYAAAIWLALAAVMAL